MTQTDPIRLVLQNHIHLAWCGPDVVILDLTADQYGLLVDASAQLSPGPASGTLLVDPAVRADVEALGIAGPDIRPMPRTPVPARRGELVGSWTPPRLTSLARAMTGTLGALATFHGRPLDRLIRTARDIRTPRRSGTLTRLAQATAAFQALHPWVPFEGDCLQRGYRLHRHLRTLGFDARWVFGVRTWPFLAHCWVQVDDLVVGDSLDRVGPFVPIMVV